MKVSPDAYGRAKAPNKDGAVLGEAAPLRFCLLGFDLVAGTCNHRQYEVSVSVTV